VFATKPVLIASDVHLGSAPPDHEKAFIAWLERAATSASWIILNGDLFDFWFEYRTGTTRGHDQILRTLRMTVDQGTPLTLMGGNHDWWGGAFLRDEIGIEFLQDPVVREVAGRRTLLAHGDGLGSGDLGYRILRMFLRGHATRWAFGMLPPAIGDRIASSISRTGRHWEKWEEQQQARSDTLEKWAASALSQDQELELIVLGHTHRPLLREVRPGQWYANCGDWVINKSYLSLQEGRPPRLIEWDGRAI
ncbi:uncharacterized protein METZ01_LOCUS95158, partial [marine metagenome]